MNVMVVASHFDDEVIGCGGAVRKYIEEGHNVYVCFICGGTSVRYPEQALLETRREHSRKVAALLGIKELFFYDFPLIMLDTLPQLELVTALEKVIFNVKPEVIFTHYNDDINSDHRVVHNATMVWCRPSKTPFIKKVLFYETMGSTQNFLPNYYIPIDNQIEKKLSALALYTTETNVQTRTVETLRKIASYRGAEINAAYAEAFVVNRIIE